METPILEIDGSPVYDEIRRLIAAGGAAPINLVALWDVAGRPWWCSPRTWNDHNVDIGREDVVIEDSGDEPETLVTATPGDAMVYSMALDPKILDAVVADLLAGIRIDPAFHLIGCPDVFTAEHAIAAVVADRGVTRPEAVGVLMATVIERTSGLGELERETKVAQIRRALEGVALPRLDGHDRQPSRGMR